MNFLRRYDASLLITVKKLSYIDANFFSFGDI